ncbi:PilX N-terminal domain-containing pilus assembly protein [Variovorax sp. dw_954]|uniref:pilus assembly PilX family protein n=1 Tax=Variovorax sp. dw_954 TaxID=2720078 RepID=UPI001BD40E4B|nr:PilX N-terminal domain-containing pilus assembly protein [Variovorax sp. dw_954]
MKPHLPSTGPRAQRGVALLTSLLILVIVSLVAVSMYRSFGTQESIAGNTLEKQRSLSAAESAVRYGEWWLGQGNAGAGGACSGTVDGTVQANMRICSGTNSKLVNPGTLPWTSSITYKPPQMPVNTAGNVNSQSSSGTVGDVNYAKSPALHIALLGYSADGKSVLYQITGVGYGGRDTTVSVVQSVYAAYTSSTKDLSGP